MGRRRTALRHGARKGQGHEPLVQRRRCCWAGGVGVLNSPGIVGDGRKVAPGSSGLQSRHCSASTGNWPFPPLGTPLERVGHLSLASAVVSNATGHMFNYFVIYAVLSA